MCSVQRPHPLVMVAATAYRSDDQTWGYILLLDASLTPYFYIAVCDKPRVFWYGVLMVLVSRNVLAGATLKIKKSFRGLLFERLPQSCHCPLVD